MAKFPWAPLLGFVVVVALAFTLIQIADLGLGEAGTEDLEQQNETLVVTYDNDVHVSRSPQFDRYTHGFGDDETLTNEAGSQLTEGSDYEWNTTDGGVTFIDTANTTDSENVNITYSYEYNVGEVRQSEPILRVIVQSVPLWVLIPVVLFLGLLLVWAWALIREHAFGIGRGSPGGGR